MDEVHIGALLVYEQIQYFMQIMAAVVWLLWVFVLKCQAEQSPRAFFLFLIYSLKFCCCCCFFSDWYLVYYSVALKGRALYVLYDFMSLRGLLICEEVATVFVLEIYSENPPFREDKDHDCLVERYMQQPLNIFFNTQRTLCPHCSFWNKSLSNAICCFIFSHILLGMQPML